MGELLADKHLVAVSKGSRIASSTANMGSLTSASRRSRFLLALRSRPSVRRLSQTELTSYLPISNLSFASKLVERSVAARSVKHCDQNHLFPVRQSAYRLHPSTETAVLIVHNDVIQAIDNGQLTVMLFLDLTSAFDTVDHDIMLSTLHRRFSVEGAALNWFTRT